MRRAAIIAAVLVISAVAGAAVALAWVWGSGWL
jgi:hypothetical protein